MPLMFDSIELPKKWRRVFILAAPKSFIRYKRMKQVIKHRHYRFGYRVAHECSYPVSGLKRLGLKIVALDLPLTSFSYWLKTHGPEISCPVQILGLVDETCCPVPGTFRLGNRLLLHSTTIGLCPLLILA